MSGVTDKRYEVMVVFRFAHNDIWNVQYGTDDLQEALAYGMMLMLDGDLKGLVLDKDLALDIMTWEPWRHR